MSKTVEELINESKEIQRSILELGLREQIYQELIQKFESLDVDLMIKAKFTESAADVMFHEFEGKPFEPETEIVEDEN